ncbi:manganese containing catalase [Duganella sp. BK701]|nr:manganese containing catalase [Duganella sp. BK701]
MLEQFGGPQGELAAACRYFTLRAEDDPGRKDMLFDIATEELSHLEVIGNIVVMLNKGAKGRLAEGADEEAEMYRAISGAGNSSHVTQLLYGADAPLINSAGVPWSAAYIDTIGEPTADLRSNIAAPEADPLTGAELGEALNGVAASDGQTGNASLPR